jgi:hypothetical protein
MTFQGSILPSLFASDAIAEGEVIESLALKSLHEAATPDQRRDLRLEWHETTGTVASIAAALPPLRSS